MSFSFLNDTNQHLLVRVQVPLAIFEITNKNLKGKKKKAQSFRRVYRDWIPWMHPRVSRNFHQRSHDFCLPRSLTNVYPLSFSLSCSINKQEKGVSWAFCFPLLSHLHTFTVSSFCKRYLFPLAKFELGLFRCIEIVRVKLMLKHSTVEW